MTHIDSGARLGALKTKDKVLRERSIAAVQELRDAGILFAITSGRAPRGCKC